MTQQYGYPPGVPPGYPQPQQPYGQPRPPQQQGYPQAPPPGYGVPPQGFGAPVGGMPGAVPTQVQMPAPPQAPPAFVGVDEAAIAAAYEKAREEHAAMAKGNGTQKFVDLSPQPVAKDWKVAPVGTKKQFIGWICQPTRPGQPPFALDNTHFWKGPHQPQGDSVPCLGMQLCPVCIAREILIRNGDQNAIKHAKSVGKTRKQVVYQMLSRDMPQEHVCSDGVMRPLLMRISFEPHVAIGEKFKLKGLASFLDPQNARPIVVTKVKTGTGDMDVDTTIDDLDIQPVNPVLWNALANPHDLSQFVNAKPASLYQTAVMEMNLPFAPEVQQACMALAASEQQRGGQQYGGQPSYAQAPNPPMQNPYAQQGPPQGYAGAPPPPPGYPPQQMQGYAGYAPQQPQYGGPPQGPQVPANVPPHLAQTMMGKG